MSKRYFVQGPYNCSDWGEEYVVSDSTGIDDEVFFRYLDEAQAYLESLTRTLPLDVDK
jgi:hypothetical protein